MKEILQFIVEHFVTVAAIIKIRKKEGDTLSILELRVAKEDVGRVIGKQGNTAHSIRWLLAAIASRQHRRASLEIIDR
jgi:predicted RNA-binding protein YlqC (UPF0109 family)